MDFIKSIKNKWIVKLIFTALVIAVLIMARSNSFWEIRTTKDGLYMGHNILDNEIFNTISIATAVLSVIALWANFSIVSFFLNITSLAATAGGIAQDAYNMFMSYRSANHWEMHFCEEPTETVAIVACVLILFSFALMFVIRSGIFRKKKENANPQPPVNYGNTN